MKNLVEKTQILNLDRGSSHRNVLLDNIHVHINQNNDSKTLINYEKEGPDEKLLEIYTKSQLYQLKSLLSLEISNIEGKIASSLS